MSITLNGSTFDLSYVNVGSDFIEQPGAVLSIDPWGLDTITRRFTGRLDKVTTELSKYGQKRNKKDAIYPDLFATKWEMTEDAPFATLSVTFRGVIGGKARDPEFENDLRAATVTLRYTDSAGDEDGSTSTLKYYAPYVTAMYAVRTKPNAAKYRNKIDFSGDAFQVISMTGDSERALNFKRGGDLNGATTGSATLARVSSSYNAIVEISTPTFKVKQVGQWFTVTETNEALLVPSGLNRNKRIVRVA